MLMLNLYKQCFEMNILLKYKKYIYEKKIIRIEE